MNRIKKLFDKKEPILSIYYTAGFPNISDTVTIAKHLELAGVDLLEIGIPYSDPIADGPVIQESSKKALENGMHIELLFSQLKALRKEVSIPVLLMGYFNPILQYGVDKFCEKCKEHGIDGCIIPDLPINEYENLYKSTFESNNLSNIFLITPQTSDDRINKIDALSDSFIYLISSSATTGKTSSLSIESENYFKRIAEKKLKNPLIVGFGIHDRTTYITACKYANGAIIGSAFVKSIAEGFNQLSINSFVNQIIKR